MNGIIYMLAGAGVLALLALPFLLRSQRQILPSIRPPVIVTTPEGKQYRLVKVHGWHVYGERVNGDGFMLLTENSVVAKDSLKVREFLERFSRKS
jgi:hypothetical protein